MSFPFNSEEGLIVVPVRLWGPMGDTVVRLALDTGATGSVVNWDVVVLLGYDPAIVPDRVQMTTGSGVEFVPRIMIEKIEALGQERRTFPLLCHTLPPSATVDGVLGLDFFRIASSLALLAKTVRAPGAGLPGPRFIPGG